MAETKRLTKDSLWHGWIVSADGTQYLSKNTVTDFLIDDVNEKQVSINAYSSGSNVFATVGKYYAKDLGVDGALTTAKEDLRSFLSLPEMNIDGTEEQAEETETEV